jgi:hypothetical protein
MRFCDEQYGFYRRIDLGARSFSHHGLDVDDSQMGTQGPSAFGGWVSMNTSSNWPTSTFFSRTNRFCGSMA